MTIAEITLHRLRLPLTTPYHVSYRVYEDFEPIIVEARDRDGRTGWGEGHISPGYSAETVDSGWAFCRAHGARLPGREVAAAKADILAAVGESPVAATALVTALEMLEGNPRLNIETTATLKLLAPFHATAAADIAPEVAARLEQGFTTLKVKVGKDVESDLARVAAVQDAVQKAAGGTVAIRLDANRGFSRDDGCRFAASLDPACIELFEQPCDAADWDSNEAVAAVSTVPVMLDESIYGVEDIERAAGIDGVEFVKLKLKKLGGIERLHAGLKLIRKLGMEPVLGDGVAADIGCWMEACVAIDTITNAGEFNGFLKPKIRLFKTPLEFSGGALHLVPGFVPEIDRAVMDAHRLGRERFAAPVSAPAARVR